MGRVKLYFRIYVKFYFFIFIVIFLNILIMYYWNIFNDLKFGDNKIIIVERLFGSNMFVGLLRWIYIKYIFEMGSFIVIVVC